MTFLLLQIFLLLLAAFLVGAMLACALRRWMFAGSDPQRKTTSAQSGADQGVRPSELSTSPAVDRFGRALTGIGLPAEPQPVASPTTPAPSAAGAAAPGAAPKMDFPPVVNVAAANRQEAERPSPVPSHPATSVETVQPTAPPAPPTISSPKQAAPAAPSPAPSAPPPITVSPPWPAPQPAVPAEKMPAAPAPAKATASASSPPPTSAAPPQAASRISDDLTLIRGIDTATEAKLTRLGVTRFEEIARWRANDVARANGALEARGRVERENWIEQAAILAKNSSTKFARDKASSVPAGAPRPLAEPAVAKPFAAGASTATAPPAATPPVNPVTANPPATNPPAATPTATVPVAEDSLQRISGIDAATEQLLRSQGVTRFAQIASWTTADARRVERVLGRVGRVGDEYWIEQARVLASGGSGPARPKTNLDGMKSVRSEALRGSFSSGRDASGSDDLKRIRGIGVLIEKRLNSLSITGFEQIANWTGADIDRVSEALDIKGKIERENWVEQARILASGGQTAYSRRP